MKQFLYRIRPTRPEMLTEGLTEREARIIGEHFGHLQRLAAEGTVFMAGRTLNDDASTFGITVFQAETEERAAEIVRSDPAVGQGVMQAELFPYRVAVWSHANPLAE
jgi:uncharacterized protein